MLELADFQARNIYNSKNIPFEDLLNRVSEIDEKKSCIDLYNGT